MADAKTPAPLEEVSEAPSQPIELSGSSQAQATTPSPAVPDVFTIPEPQENIEPDNELAVDVDDADSTFGGSIASDTTSIASSVLNYRYENGRRYHAYHEGQYVMPNDEREQDRMDLAHHVFKLVLGGALCRAPIGSKPQRALDFGTGTGIWAIEFADEFPSATVIGCDLSPIQPSWIPPNCRFQVDDAETTWQYSQPFDFIHGRAMAGSIGNWDRLFQQAYDNLRPGGWMELQEFDVWIYSDDGTLANAPICCQWQEKLDEASTKFGKKMNIAYRYKGQMEATGFVDVVDDIYKVPFSPWPRDRRLKEISRYQQLAMLEAVEPYTLALFTRVLGWSIEEVQVLIAGVKNELKDRSVHMYGKMHFVYGRKPEKAVAL